MATKKQLTDLKGDFRKLYVRRGWCITWLIIKQCRILGHIKHGAFGIKDTCLGFR
jgi:hypothetical protein